MQALDRTRRRHLLRRGNPRKIEPSHASGQTAATRRVRIASIESKRSFAYRRDSPTPPLAAAREPARRPRPAQGLAEQEKRNRHAASFGRV